MTSPKGIAPIQKAHESNRRDLLFYQYLFSNEKSTPEFVQDQLGKTSRFRYQEKIILAQRKVLEKKNNLLQQCLYQIKHERKEAYGHGYVVRRRKTNGMEITIKENQEQMSNRDFVIYGKTEEQKQKLPPVIISKLRTAKDFEIRKV